MQHVCMNTQECRQWVQSLSYKPQFQVHQLSPSAYEDREELIAGSQRSLLPGRCPKYTYTKYINTKDTDSQSIPMNTHTKYTHTHTHEHAQNIYIHWLHAARKHTQSTQECRSTAERLQKRTLTQSSTLGTVHTHHVATIWWSFISLPSDIGEWNS